MCGEVPEPDILERRPCGGGPERATSHNEHHYAMLPGAEQASPRAQPKHSGPASHGLAVRTQASPATSDAPIAASRNGTRRAQAGSGTVFRDTPCWSESAPEHLAQKWLRIFRVQVRRP